MPNNFMNNNDTKVSFSAETVAGTTNATPTMLEVPKVEYSMRLAHNSVKSNVVYSDRSANGQRKSGFHTEGSLKTQLRQGAWLTSLFEGALGGTAVTNVIKGSNVDKSYTFEKILKNAGTSYYVRSLGTQVAGVTVSAAVGSPAEASFDLIGLDETTGTTIITGATYTAVPNGIDLIDQDMLTINIAGLTGIKARSIEFSNKLSKTALSAMGSSASIGIASQGAREAMIKVTFYATDLSPHTLMAKSDTTINVDFTLAGSDGKGYKFELPNANYASPTLDESGEAVMWTAEFYGRRDSTKGTDVVITELP